MHGSGLQISEGRKITHVIDNEVNNVLKYKWKMGLGLFLITLLVSVLLCLLWLNYFKYELAWMLLINLGLSAYLLVCMWRIWSTYVKWWRKYWR